MWLSVSLWRQKCSAGYRASKAPFWRMRRFEMETVEFPRPNSETSNQRTDSNWLSTSYGVPPPPLNFVINGFILDILVYIVLYNLTRKDAFSSVACAHHATCRTCFVFTSWLSHVTIFNGYRHCWLSWGFIMIILLLPCYPYPCSIIRLRQPIVSEFSVANSSEDCHIYSCSDTPGASCWVRNADWNRRISVLRAFALGLVMYIPLLD